MPCTAAAAMTFGQFASSVVGLGGSSLSKMPQTALKSFWLRTPARMPSTSPNGLYTIFMRGETPQSRDEMARRHCPHWLLTAAGRTIIMGTPVVHPSCCGNQQGPKEGTMDEQ